MKVIVTLLLALFCGLLPVYSSSCAATSRVSVSSNPGSRLTLTQADNGKSISIRVSQTLTIALPENPTTGYKWAVEPSSQPLLVLKSSEYVTTAKPGLVGAGGQRILRFQARRTGTEKLRLKLWRSWEGDSSITDRFAVTVTVQR